MKCKKKNILLFVLSLSSTFYGNGNYGDYPKYEGVLGEALFEAVDEGNLKEVKALIKEGTSVRKAADINAKDRNGETPLMLASYYGHIDTVKVLIKNGMSVCKAADVNAYCFRSDMTVLDYASSEGYTEIVKLLRKAGAKKQ